MTVIGYDITDGLDGKPIEHDTGSITVIGPEAERAAFRERFLARIEGVEVIHLDFDEVSNAQLEQFSRDQTYSKEPRLIVVSNPPQMRETSSYEPTSKWRRLTSLAHMENLGLAVFFEFDSFQDDRPRNTVHWSRTIILIGPTAHTDAYVITSNSSIAESFTETYVVCWAGPWSSSLRPRALPVVLA